MKQRQLPTTRLLWVIACLFTLNATKAQTCGFTYSKTITVDHNQVSGSSILNDFPMLISITDNDLRTTANGGHVENANGYDIYFLDGSGERMAHEIVSYNATNGSYSAWVKIPALYVDFDTDFQMVYGNVAVSSDPSSTATWESNYEAVLHLQESGNGSDDEFLDATANGHHGTGGGLAGAGNAASTPARVAGKFGFAQDFDDASGSDFIRLDAVNDATWTAVTVEAWVYPHDNGDDRVFGKSWGTNTNDQTWLLRKTGGTAGTRMRTNSNNNGGFDPATLNNNEWQHLVVTWDGADNTLRVYRNGVEEGNTGLTGTTLYTTPTVDEPTIGNTTTLNRGYDGLLQEARVSSTARSAGWIATQFANQDDPSAFYSVGPETGGTYVPTIPTCGHSYRKVITINNGQVSGSGSHTDFPVLISFTDNDLRTIANGGGVQNDNGYDIVFTDNNFIPLDYQIERYVPTTGEYHAWVRIPSLPTGSDYEINMMYGNPDIFADPSTYCTWSGDYEGVWHLDNSTADGTSNGQDGIDNGTADIGGRIGRGRDFDGTDFIELTSFPNLTSDITISAWIQTTDNTAAGQRVFCDDEVNSGGYALSIGDPGTGRPRFYSRSMNNVIVDGSNSINNNTWYYVTAVRDQTNQDRLIYVNGTLVGSDLTDTGTWGTDNGDASIGGETAAGETANRFEGRLDEVRVASTPRSVDWIITEYNNQNNPSGFYSVGSEISLNATTTGSGDWDQTGIWNTGVVPGDGSIVTILHDVDLDDRNVKPCSLTVSTAANNTARLDVDLGYTLEVEEDLRIIGDGSSNFVDANLRTINNSSKIIVNGDLIVDHDSNDDILVSVLGVNDSLIVRGNFLLEHDGGDNIFIQVNNPTGVILVENNIVANMNSGTDDIFRIDMNSGTFLVNGTLTARRYSTFSDLEIDLDGGDLTVDSLVLFSSGGGGDDQIEVMVDGNSVMTVNNLYMEMGGGDDHRLDVNVNGGTDANLTINNNLVVNKTGGDDLFFRVNEANSVFHVGGDLTITSTGGEELQFQVNNTSDVDIDGNMTITHSSGQINHIYLQGGGANPTFDIGGDFTVNWNAGFDVFSLEMPGGALTVGGNLMVNKADNTNNVWFNLDDATLTVTDTLKALHNGNGEFFIELDGASALNAGTFMGVLNGVSTAEELLIDLDDNSQMNVTGDIDLEMNTGNDLEFHLGNNSTGSTAQLTVGGNMTLDHNGAVGGDDIQFYLFDDTRADIGGVFAMETDGSSGGPANFRTRLFNNAVLQVDGNLVMNNTTGSGYLEIELNDNTTLGLGGDVVRNASPNNYGLIESNSATTTIEYNGNNAQVFADEDGAGTDGIEYEQVVINNTFGTEPQLTMEAPVTLTNSITFTDGVLQSTAVNLLTIGDNATTNGGNANSYVSGPLQKEGNDPFVFPLGKDGNWARLGISDLQNGPTVTDQFTAEYFLSTHTESFLDSNNYAGITGGFYNVSIVEYWDLTRDAGNTEPKVTLYWESGTNSYIDNLTDLKVAHLSGPSTWTNEGGTTGGTVAAGSVTTTTNLSTFSPFTFGSLSPGSNPLPIELLTFDAQPSGNIVKLSWETLSEINNDYFTVERSLDGLNFEEVLRQQGAGNSNERLLYHAADDAPYKGVSYYRLKQTDYNGDFSYSGLVAVQFINGQQNVMIYPNPAASGSTINISGVEGITDHIELISTGGKQTILQLKRNNIVELPGTLSEGVYLLKVVSRNGTTINKLIVR